ncbi:phosphoribosylglycinamide formyltransferase, partial [Candidatus Microgenomates bacterium]
MSTKKRLAILISGSGSTASAIIAACQNSQLNLQPVLLISSNTQAAGLGKAQKLGVATQVVNPQESNSLKEFGEKLLAVLKKHSVDLISQNGWLPKTPLNVVHAFENKISNQHPGPLDPNSPVDFGGMGMYGIRVIAARLLYIWLTRSYPWTESCVHLVTSEFDKGDVIRTERLVVTI